MMIKRTLLISISLSVILLFMAYGCSPNQLLKDKDKIQKDPSYCNKFSGEERDSCYTFAALSRVEPELCNKIMSVEIREGCVSELAHEITNPEECEKLNNPKSYFRDRTACYNNVARFTENESFCYNVGPKDENECETEISENEEVINECIFYVTYTKNNCLRQIAAIKQDVGICEKKLIDSPYDHKSFCYDSVAISKGNISLCKHISCIGRIAINTGNVILCEQIDNPELSTDREQDALFYYPYDNPKPTRDEEKDGCFGGVANALNDGSLCVKIQDKGLLKHCLTHFSNQFEDKNVCFEIDDEEIKNSCFVWVAQNTNDIKVCENIHVKPFVKECWMDEQGREHCTLEGSSTLIPTLRDTHKAYLDKTEAYKVIECYLPIVEKDYNKCDEVAYDSMKLRNACYFILSIEINNSQICNKIVIPKIDNVTCEDYLQAYNLESHLVRTRIQ